MPHLTGESSGIIASLLIAFAHLPWSLQLIIPPTVILVPYFLYNLFLHPLSRVPGPLSARLGIPIWRFLHAYRRDYCWAEKAIHDQHGPIVRLGPNFVSITDPSAVRAVYAHGSKFAKSDFYHAFGKQSLYAVETSSPTSVPSPDQEPPQFVQ